MTDPKIRTTPIGSLDLQDKLTAIGAIALAVLLFFPWCSYKGEGREALSAFGAQVSMKWTGSVQGKLSLLAAVLTALWMLLPGFRAALAPTLGPKAAPLMTMILSGTAFILGPFWFLLENMPSAGPMGLDAGRTFWFFLALLAGAASAGGAAWKTFGTPRPAP
jgi:hypothetical protein